MSVDVLFGDWRRKLQKVKRAHAVITDVPYSERVVRGQRSAGPQIARSGPQQVVSARIAYSSWTREDAHEFVEHWFPRVEAWFVVFCSDDIAGWLRADLEEQGCKFAWTLPAVHEESDFPALAQTIPWLKPDAAPAFNGLMPAPQAEWIVVARPRGRCVRRHRPGFYLVPQARGQGFVGAKPLNLMRAIVRDYSEPGSLVVDPFCGTGTTALACLAEGRSCITSEIDAITFKRAQRRIRTGITADLVAALDAREALRREAEVLKALKPLDLFPAAAE